ncbi:MAG: efflux RND transporter periplasmic adaptor subunit [Cyclobacteriaceae bacterium]
MAKKKKSSNKILYIFLAVALILIATVVVAKKNGWIGSDRTTKVDLAEAKKTTVIEKVSASGAIQPEVEIKVSPEVSGEIIDLQVEEGDSVEIGQLLVKIRPDNFQNALERSVAALNQQKANLAEARARKSRAQASYKRAELDFNRQKKLKEQNVISQADFETAQANYDIAREDLNSAEQSVIAAQYLVKSSSANVADARENLNLTTIRAPMTGIVSKLNVEKGERVLGTSQMQGTELFRIADLRKMEVRVDVNENDIIRVSIGDTAIIDVDSYSYMDKMFKGIVTQIANTANDKVSSDAVTEFEVRIRVINESYRDLVEKENMKYPFRPGMTASVDIVTQQKDDIITVPLSAVTTRSDKDEKSGRPGKSDDDDEEEIDEEEDLKEIVFVSVDGIAKKREVKTGINDFDNIEILDGLQEGDIVVTGPFLVVSKRLKDGDAISANEKKPENTDKKED